MNEAKETRRVAVMALMLNAQGEVLAVSRKTNHEDLGLPGGKVEPGESCENALIRELREETGCEATDFEKVFATIDSGGYWAITYVVRAWAGEPRALEAGAVVWVKPSRMLEESCSFRGYNGALFQHLQLEQPRCTL